MDISTLKLTAEARQAHPSEALSALSPGLSPANELQDWGKLPQDLCALMEHNLREQRPLLTDAKIYRGTMTAAQSEGADPSKVEHAALLPKIAAEYAYGGAQDKDVTGFIGEYALNREAIFYKDWTLDRVLAGQAVDGVTVPQLEARLKPHVEAYATAAEPVARDAARSAIEDLVTKHAYETGLSVRQQDGALTPVKLYYYTGGRPESSKAALAGMSRITEINSSIAKTSLVENYRSGVVSQLQRLKVVHPAVFRSAGLSYPQALSAQSAFDRIASVAQKTLSSELRDRYQDASLLVMLDKIPAHPESPQLGKLKQLGLMLHEGAHSKDPVLQKISILAAEHICRLPEEATYKELLGVVAKASLQVREELGQDAPDQQAVAEKPGLRQEAGKPSKTVESKNHSNGAQPVAGRFDR